MVRTILSHLRGNVIAYLALFVALSAGAYAAKKAPKNSVVTKSIVNKAVKVNKLADAAVETSKLSDAAVATSKLADGAVTEEKLQSFAYTDVTAFTNSWGPLSTFTPGYGKDVAGFVHLRGRLTGGNLGIAAFTLPEGFRPITNETFGAGGISAGSISLACVVSVFANGSVVPGVTGADTGCSAAGQTELYGITFKAAG